MADADKTLITRAEITSVTSPATGRKILTLDNDTFEIGTTGVRDLSALMNMTNLDSGRLLLSRTGDRVQLWLVDIKVKAGAPSSFVLMTQDRTATSSFFPPYVATGRAIASSGTGTTTDGPSSDVYVNTHLGVALHGATAGLTYQAAIDWVTLRGWPSVAAGLPGVEDGAPIGV